MLEMKGIQTGLRADKNFPGYSSFACVGHKWEDDYLQNSCRWGISLACPQATLGCSELHPARVGCAIAATSQQESSSLSYILDIALQSDAHMQITRRLFSRQ